MKANRAIKLALACFSMLFIVDGYSQKKKIYPKEDCNTSVVLQAMNGDTVLVRCDTIYVLNKNSFAVLQNLNLRVRNGFFVTRELHELDSVKIHSLTASLDSAHRDYRLLKNDFDTLTRQCIAVIDSTREASDRITGNILVAKKELDELRANLNTAQALLKDEKKQRAKLKLNWGLGGFAVGIGVTSLIFLVTK
jgi:hypothetical protein